MQEEHRVKALAAEDIANMSQQQIHDMGESARWLSREQIEAMSEFQARAIDDRAVRRLRESHATEYALALRGRTNPFGKRWLSRRPESKVVPCTTDRRGRLTGHGWRIFTRFVGTGESVYSAAFPSREAAEEALAKMKAEDSRKEWAPRPGSKKAERGVWAPWSTRYMRTKHMRWLPSPEYLAEAPAEGEDARADDESGPEQLAIAV
ncbi:MAG: hypothetical protein OXK74_02150 [Gemmatimonadota bacterium]|nr:hypothetical protein [Gemmatimonadota bacterium]